MQFDGVDAIEQVLPEGALGHTLVQRTVGGTDEAHIDALLLGGANACEHPLLDGTQQLGLQRHRQVAYLVEEKRTARGHLHASRLGCAGIGEGSLLVAEELALEERLGYAAQIYRHQRMCRTCRIAVQGTRYEVLARTVLAQDEDVGIGLRQTLHHIHQLHHSGRPPYDGWHGALCHRAHLLLQRGLLAPRPTQLGCCGERGHQLLVLPRLGHKVCGACLDGCYGLVHIRVGRHHHHHRFGVASQDALQHLHALLSAAGVAAEVHVEQYHLGGICGHKVGYALGRGAHLHLLKVRLQQQVQCEEHIFIVIYDEYRSVFHTVHLLSSHMDCSPYDFSLQSFFSRRTFMLSHADVADLRRPLRVAIALAYHPAENTRHSRQLQAIAMQPILCKSADSA